MVADEGDAADQRRWTVGNFEHHIDPVLREFDDLRLHPRVEIAAPCVEVENALAVGLGGRRREDRAWPQLQLRPQRRIGQRVVALEGDPVDDRVLLHLHHQRVAVAPELDVGEQAGGVERLQAAIELVGVERIARPHQHVGEDRARLEALIPLYLDIGNVPARKLGERDGRAQFLSAGDNREWDEHKPERRDPRSASTKQKRIPPLQRRPGRRDSKPPEPEE